MKIPLKAFIVISADSPYPNRSDVFIGGVASSAASETAWEQDGIVVPLTGTYDTDELRSHIKNRILDLEGLIKFYNEKPQPLSNHDKDHVKITQERLTYWTEQEIKLTDMEKNMENFTNLKHFNLQELVFMKVKLDEESLGKLKS